MLASTALAGAQSERPAARPAGAVIAGPQWTIVDDGGFVTAEGAVLRLRFAHGGKGAGGWFKGGGGEDLSIVELYHKPTSPTLNLIFRNGAWGGKMDALDYWEAEGAAKDGADHNAPDFATTTDAQLVSHRVTQRAGRLIARADFRFKAWRIERTHTVYPWGDMTVHARLRVDADTRWNYLGHRFHFGVSRARLDAPQEVDWGANYQDDGEVFHAWSDMYGPDGKFRGREPYLYKQPVRAGVDTNTAISMYGRQDPHSGFMIDDADGDDPDIVVMNGDPATWLSPFDRVSRTIGGVNYVETGMYTPPWHKQRQTHADCCWFYATVKPPAYGQPMLWKSELGEWTEAFHLFFRQGLTPEDYLPLWRARARDLAEQEPTEVAGAKVELNETDRLYHFTAEPGAKAIRFRWKRAGDAPRPIDYRTAFVIENVGKVASAAVESSGGPGIEVYPDAERREALVVLSGPQPSKAEALDLTIDME